MRERGTVITVYDGSVDVRMDLSAGCAGCGACSRGSTGEAVIRGVRDALGSTVGDVVEVDIPDKIRGRAAAAVFIVPVACLMIGYWAGLTIGRWLGTSGETAAVAGALASMSAAMLGIRAAERRLASEPVFSPHVGAIISRGRGQK